jgi:NAD(P)-dependent dehydrogenase (short-subunit alcohol dehydrogenase family)
MDVQGKVIVISGVGQGLGQKMAEMLSGQGADLALVDLDHAKLRETVRFCSRGKVQGFPADVTDERSVAAAHVEAPDPDVIMRRSATSERTLTPATASTRSRSDLPFS